MITMYFLLFLILKTAKFFSLYTNKNHGRNGLTTYGRTRSMAKNKLAETKSKREILEVK